MLFGQRISHAIHLAALFVANAKSVENQMLKGTTIIIQNR